MAVPKRKTSRSNTRSRRAQWKAAPIHLVPCSNRACRQPKLAHVTCPKCGQHKDRQVLPAAA